MLSKPWAGTVSSKHGQEEKKEAPQAGGEKAHLRACTEGGMGCVWGESQRQVLENENELKSGYCNSLIPDFLLGQAAL